MKREFVIAIAVVLAIIIAVLWYYGAPRSTDTATEQAIEALTEVPDLTETTIPPDTTTGVPALNPVDEVNPFKYANPFE